MSEEKATKLITKKTTRLVANSMKACDSAFAGSECSMMQLITALQLRHPLVKCALVSPDVQTLLSVDKQGVESFCDFIDLQSSVLSIHLNVDAALHGAVWRRVAFFFLMELKSASASEFLRVAGLVEDFIDNGGLLALDRSVRTLGYMPFGSDDLVVTGAQIPSVQ